MAKYTARVRAEFNRFAAYLNEAILHGGVRVTLVDDELLFVGGAPCLLQVYDGGGAAAGGRVTLSVQVLQIDRGILAVTGITAGGGRNGLFRLSAMGEDPLMDKLVGAVEAYQGKRCWN